MSDHGHAEAHPEPAHPEPAHTEAHAPAAGNAENQLQSIRDSIDAKKAEIERKINAAAGKVQGFLRFGMPGTPTKHNILIEPVYAAGDVLGTAGRRVWEVADTTGAMIRATLKMATDPLLHPLNTIKHPIKYAANFGRIFTTSIENYANILNAIPRSLQEVYERGTARPSERLLGRIPLIGSSITKLTNGLGWVIKKPRELTEWLTKPVYGADEWMKGQQG